MVSERLNRVAEVIVAGICWIVIETDDGGLLGSSFVAPADTPVPTCRPAESRNTMLHWICCPPNGAVTDRTRGSERIRPPSLIEPVIGSSVTAPSTLASRLQETAVTGNVDAWLLSIDTVTVAGYVRLTSFSITHGATIVSAHSSASVATSPSTSMTSSTSPITGIAASTADSPSTPATAAPILPQAGAFSGVKSTFGIPAASGSRRLKMFGPLTAALALPAATSTATASPTGSPSARMASKMATPALASSEVGSLMAMNAVAALRSVTREKTVRPMVRMPVSSAGTRTSSCGAILPG